ncbi:MAG: hypothetical protein WC656_06060 [Sulfurimonas sp.]
MTKFLGYSLFFILALMYFTPKASVYYFLETRLIPHAVAINSEAVIDNAFTLSVNHANISVQSVESANIAETNVKIFAFYNRVAFKDVTLSSAAQAFIPRHVENADIRYTLLNPLNVVAKINGAFGEADVKFNLLERALHLKVMPSELMLKEYKSTLQNMSKNENGEYIYDKNISL